jgi:hypothetical protein
MDWGELPLDDAAQRFDWGEQETRVESKSIQIGKWGPQKQNIPLMTRVVLVFVHHIFISYITLACARYHEGNGFHDQCEAFRDSPGGG